MLKRGETFYPTENVIKIQEVGTQHACQSAVTLASQDPLVLVSRTPMCTYSPNTHDFKIKINRRKNKISGNKELSSFKKSQKLTRCTRPPIAKYTSKTLSEKPSYLKEAEIS